MTQKSSWPSSFTKADRVTFERFRIPEALVKDARIVRVTDKEAREKWYLSAPITCNLAGLVFPYPSSEDESALGTCRLRRDTPDTVKGKVKNKYLSPTGGPRCLYRPPGAAELLRSKETSIVLVEAEKSALAGTAWAERVGLGDRVLFLAMGGCWGWSQDKAALPDVAVCDGRRVLVLLDANAASTPQVREALGALVAELFRRRCAVDVGKLPQLEGVNGPDDLLALPDGDKQLQAVYDAATPATVAPFSDDALATQFAVEQKDGLRYVRAWDRWLVWDGTRWQEDATQDTGRRVQDFCHAAATKCGKEHEAKRIRSGRTRETVQREAGVKPPLAATVAQWDADPWLLNTPGGTVDLRTGELRPARREDHCTKTTGVAPDATRKPVRWLQFLREVTNGDKELPAYLQRGIGYCLTGDTSEQVFFFLHGMGKNGKSVFVSTLCKLLGDYARTAPMTTFTAARSDQHPTDLAGLRGARLVAATETEDGSRWAEAKLKMITGGERITARLMRQDFFEYTPQFKLLFSGNHKPKLRNVGEAMRRRVNLIPFAVTIAKPDPKLSQKLKAEWGGILQWAIEGCLAWQREGLNPPQAVTDATKAYLEGQDVLGQWLDEAVVDDKNARTQPSEIYHNFRRWADARGEYVFSQKEFSQKLGERGYESKKSHGKLCLALRLKSETESQRKFEGKVVAMPR